MLRKCSLIRRTKEKKNTPSAPGNPHAVRFMSSAIYRLTQFQRKQESLIAPIEWPLQFLFVRFTVQLIAERSRRHDYFISAFIPDAYLRLKQSLPVLLEVDKDVISKESRNSLGYYIIIAAESRFKAHGRVSSASAIFQIPRKRVGRWRAGADNGSSRYSPSSGNLRAAAGGGGTRKKNKKKKQFEN